MACFIVVFLFHNLTGLTVIVDIVLKGVKPKWGVRRKLRSNNLMDLSDISVQIFFHNTPKSSVFININMFLIIHI